MEADVARPALVVNTNQESSDRGDGGQRPSLTDCLRIHPAGLAYPQLLQSCYQVPAVYPSGPADQTDLQADQAQVTDVKLLHAIARRDEAALGLLYDRYRLILFGLLVRILNSREEAEDILQEVFIQVWRRAADFDELRGKPFTWLVTLARSRAIDRLRSLSARDRVAIAAAREAPDEASDAVLATFRSEQHQIVAEALAELPEEQRRALTLAYFEGLTQTEIAARLGSPLGTIKTRMRSGMIKLRGLLSGKIEGID